MVGQSFSFNGTTAYVQVPDSPVLRPTNLTVEAWVLFTSLDSSGNSTAGQQYIVFKQNTRSGNFEGYYLGKQRHGSRDNFAFVVSSASGTSAEVDSSASITTGVWYHIAGVRGSNFIQLYVNGQSVGQATVNFAQDYGNYPLYFGTSGESYWDHKLAGLLDEVSLYNRALSASEIAAIYNAGAAGKCKPSAAPNISAQPQSQTVAVGSNVGFSVVASGAAPLSYQWQLNGGPMATATTTSLTLNNVQTGNSGNYSVVVSNSVGSTTSAVAVLTVLVPPAIISQPQGQTTVAGATASFSASATGSLPMNYQWGFNGSNLSNGARITGATSTALAISSVQASDAGNYALVASNAVGVVTSAVAVLTVNGPPTITAQPTGQSVSTGANVSFNITASGTAPLSYQWLFNGTALSNGGQVSGSTTSTLALSDAQNINAGTYSVVITNVAGAVTSSVALLSISSPANSAAFTNATLITIPDSGTATPYPSTINVAGMAGTVSKVTLSLKQLSHTYIHDVNVLLAGPAGQRTLVMSHVGGTLGVTNITLNFDDAASANLPATSQVVSGTFKPTNGGGTVSFPTPAPATPYGAALSVFNGSTPNGVWSLFVLDDAVNDKGTVSGGWTLSITSSNSPPTIVTQPASQTVAVGATINFNVNASGTPPLSYQWQLNGSPIANATSSSLALSNVQISDSGSYNVVVGNSVGSVTSAVAVLNVLVPPAMSSQPQNLTTVAGNTANFNASATGSLPMSYQWRFNGANLSNGTRISGATASALAINNVQAGDAGNYTFVVSNAVGIVTSSVAALTVNGPPSITTQPSGQNVLSGANVNFSITASGTAPLSYQWLFSGSPLGNGGQVSGASTSTLSLSSVQSTNGGGYSVIITNVVGAVTSSVALLSISSPANSASFTNSALITIPDSGTATPYPSTINVTGMAGLVSKVTLSLKQLSHTYIHDVDILLVGPAGQNTLVLSHVGGTLGVTNITLNFDDAASASLPASSQVVSGTFKPTNGGGTVAFPSPAPAAPYAAALSSFYGSAPNGTWSLYVLDDSANDKGTISGGWTLSITSSNLPPAIVMQPASQTVSLGATATFNVVASGAGPLSYQWQFYGTNLTDGGNHSGATSSSLAVTNVQTNDAGSYQVIVGNGVGSVTSLVATLSAIQPIQAGPQSAGAQVLVNSRSARYLDFQHFVQPYLDNFGFPYSVIDISTNSTASALSTCAAIIIGHAQLDTNLTYLNATLQGNLVAAVNNGVGLINFDNDLSSGGVPRYQFVQSIFGFSYGAGASGASATFPATEPQSQMHYITARHPANDLVGFRSSIVLPGITVPAGTTAVVQSGGKPLVAIAKYGLGRAVQWCSYDWMVSTVLGPVDGLDDVVWRGVVWAARKPIVMRGLPNMVSMRIDDSQGPFGWLHAATAVGFKPFVALYYGSISDANASDLRTIVTAGQATASIHSTTSGTLFYFDHANEQPWPDNVQSNNFYLGTQWHTSHGIPISKVCATHYSEIGLNCFAGLKAWGMEFVPIEVVPQTIEYATPGAPWLIGGPYRLYETPQPGQVNWPTYYADWLSVPGHPEFDGQFFNIYSEVRDVASCGEWCPDNTVSSSISRASQMASRTLDSMVMTTIFSHEWYISPISATNWQAILQGVTNNLASYNPIYVTLDYASQYLRATRTSRLLSGNFDSGSGQVTALLSGKTDLDTIVHVFTGQDSAISDSTGTIPTFSGSITSLVAVVGAAQAVAKIPQSPPAFIERVATRIDPNTRFDSQGPSPSNMPAGATPVRIDSISHANGVIDLSWKTIPGRSYILQAKNGLDSLEWVQIIPEVRASTSSTSVSIPAKDPTKHFYRVLLLP